MNFKRKRPKNRRSGCLMCKSYKVNGYGKNRKNAYQAETVRKLRNARADIKEALSGIDN